MCCEPLGPRNRQRATLLQYAKLGKEFRKWLSDRSLTYVEVTNFIPRECGYHMITGDSPRKQCKHAIIGLDGNPYFDVHPSNAMIVGDRSEWQHMFIFKIRL